MIFWLPKAVLLFCFHQGAQAAIHPQVQEILQSLERSNPEVQISTSNSVYKSEGLTVARGSLFPALDLTGSYNRGSATEVTAPSYDAGGLDGGSSAVSGGQSMAQSTDGWATSLGAKYYLFTGFLVTESIERAERDLQNANLKIASQKASQKSLYLQALLEWQWLSKTNNLLSSANASLSQVREHKKRAQVLFSDADEVEFDEKFSFINFQSIKVQEGLELVEKFLLFSNPETNLEQLKKVGTIQIRYNLPSKSRLEALYVDRSLSRQQLNLEVESADGMARTMHWQKWYIPKVMLAGSYSRQGSDSGGTSDPNWSSQILFTFNLFDGFANQARNRQALIGTQIAEQTRRLETEKKVLYLQNQLMKAKTSQAEYAYKTVQIRAKDLRLSDAKRKQTQGVATDLEVNLAAVDLAKARNEGLEVMKSYHEAVLSIATELNDWENLDVEIIP